MKLSELIEHVGDDNVQVQWIRESFVSAESRKGDGEITFATDGGKVIGFTEGNDSEFVGLVVWLPRQRLPERMIAVL